MHILCHEHIEPVAPCACVPSSRAQREHILYKEHILYREHILNKQPVAPCACVPSSRAQRAVKMSLTCARHTPCHKIYCKHIANSYPVF